MSYDDADLLCTAYSTNLAHFEDAATFAAVMDQLQADISGVRGPGWVRGEREVGESRHGKRGRVSRGESVLDSSQTQRKGFNRDTTETR
jgi:hypothetical protein